MRGDLAIPDKIMISRIEDYYTHYIGKYSGGNQFMSFIVATLPENFPRDWERHKKWYTVLHTFDADGNHLGTEARFAGVTADGEGQVLGRAEAWREEMLARLSSMEFSDVAIRLFSVQIDGHTFGLVDASDLDPEWDYERVELLPNDLGVGPPWDGDYDT